MKLIVTDANILMFLSRLELLESFIGMKFEIHTTDYIIDEYYKGEKKDKKLKNLDKYIRSGKIKIHEYGYDEIISIYEKKKTLSPSDCSVYKLSLELEAILLTGDKSLKLYSEQSDIKVHGIIWLIDEMLKCEIMDKVEYKEKLTDLKGLTERLPVDEIDRRLK
jgi:rRNA-processing protein FCF1